MVRWRNWIKQGDAVDPATSDTGSNPVLATKKYQDGSIRVSY